MTEQQDGAVGRDLNARLDALQASIRHDRGPATSNADVCMCVSQEACPVAADRRAIDQLRAVLAERTALAARVAELEAERDDDLCVLAAFLLPNRRPIEEWLCILANHFEARTNALMRDAGRFAAARFRVDRVPGAADTEES
jgi:hypothetical protein